MKHPVATGGVYGKQVRDLMIDMTRYTDVDGICLGTRFALDPENLLRYSLIIVPQDMGEGLTAPMADSLRQFVQRGGRLLVVATPIATSRPDLTGVADLTEEFCGASISGRGLPGHVKPASSVLAAPGGKVWTGGALTVKVADAQVLATDELSGAPLLLRKGTAYLSCVGYRTEAAPYFRAVVQHICKPPITLEGGETVRILEAVRKDNSLCVALWNKGETTLKVDAKALGLTGFSLEVRDIVTGTVLAKGRRGRLAAGVPVRIEHENQPRILAVGKSKDLERFAGLYASEDVFQGMTERKTIESPEVVLKVPDRPGIKVGVYHGSFGAAALIGAISRHEAFNCFSLPRLDREALGKSDVVVISKTAANVYFKHASELLRSWVEGGGRLLLCFDAIGYRGHPPLFPELGKGRTNPKGDVVRIAGEHPVTGGFKTGDEFIHAYTDHVQIEKGEQGAVLVTDEKGEPVVMAGEIGKGKVVLNGMIPGYASIERGEYAGREKEPEGGELSILLNAIQWLGSE